LVQYRDLLEHNELATGADVLEELGHLISAGGGLGGDLERAVETWTW
jgi:hypothetical protein